MDNKEKCAPDNDGGIKRKVMELAEEISREINRKIGAMTENTPAPPPGNDNNDEELPSNSF